MGYQSIQHTIDVHYQGVMTVYQSFQSQAQARERFILALTAQPRMMPPVYAQLKQHIKSNRVALNPYEYVQKNDQLTVFLNQNQSQLKLPNQDYFNQIQSQVQAESDIFYAHAKAFNGLISRYPYRLFSGEYGAIPLTHQSLDHLVVVVR